MPRQSSNQDIIGPDSPEVPFEGEQQGLSAWTEIEAGRFMPRRVRGSCQGRALG